MNKTLLRRTGTVAGIVVIIGGFLISNLLGRMKAPPPREQGGKALREVETQEVKNGQISHTIALEGTLTAFDKIEIFSEVNGTLKASSKPFKVGTTYSKGALLLQIDDEEARLGILSQKSALLNTIAQIMPDIKLDYSGNYDNWKAYLDGFDLNAPLKALPEPASQQEKYFIAAKNLYSQYYTIKSAEARLAKYQIYAPFDGALTEASINPGALVRSGQKMGALMNTRRFELQATLPLADLHYIRVGNQVNLRSEDLAGAWTGRITRIGDQVDANTQTVPVFVEVSGAGLKEGMYLRGEAGSESITGAFSLPRDLLVGQDGVYEVKDSTLVLRRVELVKLTGETAIIKGLENGTLILKQPLPGAFNGMIIRRKS